MEIIETKTEYRLCYISQPWAHFTTQDVAIQWGDDWNDAPYEHNAGDPYEPSSNDAKNGLHWSTKTVAYEGWFDDPAETYGNNSPFSVQLINRGDVPWLVYSLDPGTIEIYAGTTIQEFTRLIRSVGGKVFEEVTS